MSHPEHFTTLWLDTTEGKPPRWEMRLGESRGGWRFIADSGNYDDERAKHAAEAILGREGLVRRDGWVPGKKSGTWCATFGKRNPLMSPG